MTLLLIAAVLAVLWFVILTTELIKNQAMYAARLYQKTKWSWPLHFAVVSGGTSTGPNTEIDAPARTSALEAVNFVGGISTNPSLSQGGLALKAVAYSTTAPVIALPAVSGLAVISGATVLAATLALPAAGAPSVGGNDGDLLIIINDTAAKNHTVTTPTNGVQGSLHVITMSATASTFSAIVLIAFNGTWWVLSNFNCALT